MNNFEMSYVEDYFYDDDSDLPGPLPCYKCGGFEEDDLVLKEVIKLGPVVDRADPTQTYILECGHTTI